MKMRIGAIQPSFIPWRGFFDFIASVDVFVFLDNLQYTKRSWRNRNNIKTPKGAEWLTVPVLYQHQLQIISETKIDYTQPWEKRHMGTWSVNYRAAPYFEDITSLLSPLNFKCDSISELNVKLTNQICDYLKIDTPKFCLSDLDVPGIKTERLIRLVEKLGGNVYISGPSADAYLDKEAFKRSGIGLEYKSYVYDPYPQLWGDFIGEVTVLDLIANCGPTSRDLIRSKSANRTIVEI